MRVQVTLHAEGNGLPTVDVHETVDVATLGDAMGDDVLDALFGDAPEWDVDDVPERATLLCIELRKVGESPRRRPRRPVYMKLALALIGWLVGIIVGAFLLAWLGLWPGMVIVLGLVAVLVLSEAIG